MKPSFWIACCLILLLAGCGSDRPELVPVEGTVKLDGSPLEGAIVGFQMIDPPPDYSRPSSATTDAAGKFQVQTYQPGDGLPPGKYHVMIQKREPLTPLGEGYDSETGTVNGRPVQFKLVVPSKYGDPKTSGLTAEVTVDGLTPDTFDLSSEGAGPQIQSTGPSPDDP